MLILAYGFFSHIVLKGFMRIRYSTTLDDTLLEDLKIRAVKEKKRINDLLEQAIKDYLKRPVKSPKPPK